MVRKPLRRLAGIFTALLPLAALPLHSPAAPRYDLEIIGPPAGYSSFDLYIEDLNDQGEIAGHIDSGAATRAFVRRQGQAAPWLLPGLGGAAYGLNDRGDVVGHYQRTSTRLEPAWWPSGGGLNGLDPWGAGGSAFYSEAATAINDHGEIVGHSWNGSGAERAFIWRSGSATDLGDLGGGYSFAWDVNDSGYVTGDSKNSSSFYRAYRWNGWTMQDLGTLGGVESYGNAINNQGDVVGNAYTDNFYYHAFLWREGEGMRDLGTLGGGYSTAWDINDAGQVVGRSSIGTGDHAFLWNGGRMTDLSTVFGGAETLFEATAVNAFGQVAGNTGSGKGFLLTLHPDWVGGDGWWDDPTGTHWDWAATGTAAAQVGEMHDVVIDPGVSATIRGSHDGRARTLVVGGTAHRLVTLDLNGGTTTVWDSTTIRSGGRLAGSGRLESTNFSVLDGGRVEIHEDQWLQVSVDYPYNYGTIEATSFSPASPAILEFTGAVYNVGGGRMNLRNARLLTGGLANGESIDTRTSLLALSGTTEVRGTVLNSTRGRVEVSGVAADATFWDPFVNDGTVVVTAGSTATFFGEVTGTGSFTGSGSKHFAGGLNPGHSPGLMTLGGDVQFLGGDLVMELGGTTPGTGHDKIVFTDGSTVTIDGTSLVVEWWDGFTAGAGDLFDLFDWNGVLTGTFGSVTLPVLDPGLAWDTSDLYGGGTLKVSAVPLPPSLWLALSALGLLGWLGRRHSGPEKVSG